MHCQQSLWSSKKATTWWHEDETMKVESFIDVFVFVSVFVFAFVFVFVFVLVFVFVFESSSSGKVITGGWVGRVAVMGPTPLSSLNPTPNLKGLPHFNYYFTSHLSNLWKPEVLKTLLRSCGSPKVSIESLPFKTQCGSLALGIQKAQTNSQT